MSHSETAYNTTVGKKESTTVTMLDGSIVEFAGNRRIQKTSSIAHDGKVSLRMDFINGETRHFTVPHALMGQFAAHGAEQKLGDACAGVKDIDDAVEAVDNLMDRLIRNEWTAQRETGTGAAGMSMLAKALLEHTNAKVDAAGSGGKKTPAEVREYLRGLSNEHKAALRKPLAPILARLAAEKAAKATKSGKAALSAEAGEELLAAFGD